MTRKEKEFALVAAVAAALLLAYLKSQSRDIVIPPYEALLSEFN